ncbi:hypothetical protein GOP47_0014455 [Adiantum capillus-veneris]|uniref:Uncharacterized protein n=1 Tax=Adiantum capillus-veneris TaxID=13818 RepID=A0A9D4ULT8_ADICA|nr:hypothetical protein GOP47_0014455 [Adiantum capillus-veneris]
MMATVMASGFGCAGATVVRLCSSKDLPKRRQDFRVLHVHSLESFPRQGNCAKQGKWEISRREWLALAICVSENVCAGSFMRRADAAQEEMTTSEASAKSDAGKQTDADGYLVSPLSGLLTLFDTNEKTKSGKLLPKSYLKSARNVVKSLKESLKEESSKEVDVRKSADQAKEAIRDYLQNWRGQKAVESEDSYKALEGAIKILGSFYTKQGPRALLPSDVKSEILKSLEVADSAL